jgi:predicted HNH restriction endonuclease
MTDIGREFEKEFANEFGLEQVPGSGNQWHSKLDVKGMGVRWSLKSTRSQYFEIGINDIREMIEVTEGPGGNGETPIMAVRLNSGGWDEDIIIMRKEDFAAIVTEKKALFSEDKTQAKRRLADIPELLRDNDVR